MPVLRAKVDAVAQVGAQRLKLLQTGRPGHEDGHVLVHAKTHGLAQGVGTLRAKIEQQQHIGLGRDGVGDVAAELFFGQRVVAVAHMLDALFLEDVLGRRQQTIAKHILRRDGVPALGLGHGVDQRAHGLLDGAERGHRPAECGGIAVRPRDFIGARRGHKDAAGLLGFLAHGQCLARQNAPRKEARTLLLCSFLHLAHGGGRLAFGVEQRVGQRTVQCLAVLLDRQAHSHVGKFSVGGKGAGHRHRATKLDRASGLCEGAAGQTHGCGECTQGRDLQEMTTLHGELQ